jgi:hypothetical protein
MGNSVTQDTLSYLNLDSITSMLMLDSMLQSMGSAKLLQRQVLVLFSARMVPMTPLLEHLTLSGDQLKMFTFLAK